MIINLKQDRFKTIDAAFSMLKENPSATSPLGIIKDVLDDSFKGLDFSVILAPTTDKGFKFYMGVYPEVSTTDKIVNAILSNKESKVVSELWKKNTKWVIDIDESIITSDMFTPNELTALLLHEVGHVIASNSINER